jgi:uncharacterized SAM-binding protein YcdF (DUF218 family)
MFFVASKILGFFALPSNFLIVLGLVGVALLMTTRWARLGRRLVIVAVLFLAAFGFTPLGNLLLRPLEQRFPPWPETTGAPDGIIVLAGAIDADIAQARAVPALNAAAERIVVIADLARRFPDARIVYSGGSDALIGEAISEAQFALPLFESFGIARARILLEERSRNTAENAAFTKALVKPKAGERWLLVTSAYHMPRAVGVFRRIGFPVEPYPVDWRTPLSDDRAMAFSRLSAGLARSDVALREWSGLLAYWLSGKSAALFPEP